MLLMKCDILLVQDQRKHEEELEFITLNIAFTFIITILNLGLVSWAAFSIFPKPKKNLTGQPKCNLLLCPLKPWASVKPTMWP